MVAIDALLASAFSLIVDASSLPDRETEMGDVVEGLLSKLDVSTTMGVGPGVTEGEAGARCTIFTLTSFSGSGGGGSDGRPFAVFVDVVERIEAADFSLRKVGCLGSVLDFVTFFVREGPPCEVVEIADAFELRLGRALEGVGEGGGFWLATDTERSDAPDCFRGLGTVNLEVEAESSERALLKLVSVLEVADETDLERFEPPLAALAVLVVDGDDERRGLVRVTIDGALKDLIECAEEDGLVCEGTEMLAANDWFGDAARLLTLALVEGRSEPDLALFVIVDADAADAVEAADAVVATDRIELADDVTRVRTEGVAALRALLLKDVGRIELAKLDASSSVALLRDLDGGVCLRADEPFGAEAAVVLNKSSTGTSISARAA
jgi:hypothetical protein